MMSDLQYARPLSLACLSVMCTVETNRSHALTVAELKQKVHC